MSQVYCCPTEGGTELVANVFRLERTASQVCCYSNEEMNNEVKMRYGKRKCEDAL
jgi:hypothetical protein